MSKDDVPTIDVACPVCKARLVVEAASGDVLEAEHPSTRTKDFDALLGDVASGQGRREDRFKRAFESEARRPSTLSKKFDRARKKAEHGAEDDEKPRTGS